MLLVHRASKSPPLVLPLQLLQVLLVSVVLMGWWAVSGVSTRDLFRQSSISQKSMLGVRRQNALGGKRMGLGSKAQFKPSVAL